MKKSCEAPKNGKQDKELVVIYEPYYTKHILTYLSNILKDTCVDSDAHVEAIYDLACQVLGHTQVNGILISALELADVLDSRKEKRKKELRTDLFSDFQETASPSEIFKTLRKCLAHPIMSTLAQIDADGNANHSLEGQIRELSTAFRLVKTDASILRYLYFVHKEIIDADISRNALFDLMHKALGAAKSTLYSRLKNGPLSICDLVDLEMTHYNHFELSQWTREFLSQEGEETVVTKLLYVWDGATVPLEQLLSDKTDLDILQHLLSDSRGHHILLYGEPGTGKTELAKALAKSAGKKLYLMKDTASGDAKHTREALSVASNVLNSADSILLIDEADSFLNTRYTLFSDTSGDSRKGWINSYMDSSKSMVIWICNDSRMIEPSVMRRFAFACKFHKFTVAKKAQVFGYALEKEGLSGFFTETEMKGMAGRYSVNAGGIVNAIRNLGNTSASKAKSKALIERVLRNHEIATNNHAMKDTNSECNARYDLSAVNSTVPLNEVIARLQTHNCQEYGLSLLFHGMPGTGKTEFAKYMAQALDKPLLAKRASDILDMFVGGSEKNLANAFAEAQEQDAILLLDEADSFLYPREIARHSWEKSLTNELLTQMEDFKGIFICSTNMLNGLDEASMRRFAIKVEFRPMTPDGVLRIYRKMFADVADSALTMEEEARVASIANLAPGDFAAVYKRYGQSGMKVPNEALIIALSDEIRYKKTTRNIGF